MLVTGKSSQSEMNGCAFEPGADTCSMATKHCHRCKESIMDRFVMRVHPNYEFHPACLSCASCHSTLDETSTCFVRNGIPYCKPDYFRYFGVHCHECGEVITDKVMKAGDKGYHVDCFKCSVCLMKLEPGDYYTIYNDRLYCKDDIEFLLGDNDTSSSANGSPTSEGSCPLPSPPGKKSEKTPRVRTVLSDKQLKTLKAVYSQNPKPDSLMKEHLCEVTGLSPRVIRVWFQNKRCKDKKKILQDKAMEETSSGNLPPNTPITPLTPLTPDTGSEMTFPASSILSGSGTNSFSPSTITSPPASSWSVMTSTFGSFTSSVATSTAKSDGVAASQ